MLTQSQQESGRSSCEFPATDGLKWRAGPREGEVVRRGFKGEDKTETGAQEEGGLHMELAVLKAVKCSWTVPEIPMRKWKQMARECWSPCPHSQGVWNRTRDAASTLLSNAFVL